MVAAPHTTNPDDYAGREKLIRIIPVTRPPLPHGNLSRTHLTVLKERLR